MKRHLMRFLPVLALLLLVVPTVLASVRIDDNGQVPFYARISRGQYFNDGQWVSVVFYRDPSCVPDDFNLLDFFDFPDGVDMGAFDCQPPTTDNISIWENGPDVDFAPLKAIFRGLGDVPVWFVELDELEAAVADDVLTIGELEGMPSLMIGSARRYRETLRPGESHPETGGSIAYSAKGKLEDDRKFTVWVRSNTNRMYVRIKFK